MSATPSVEAPADQPPLVGVIPAAGRGIRAYPYTARIPKSMLAVDGVPLIQRNLELLRDQMGAREVVIVVGHCGEVIERHLGDGSRFGVRITYVVNDRLDLELPYSVHLGTRDVAGHCCVVLADECYVDSNHAELRRRFDRDALVTCALVATDHPKHVRKNYAVTIRDGAITGLEEKPRRASRGLMGAGTYVLHPQAVARLHAAFRDPQAGPRDWTTWLDGLCRAGERVLPFALAGAYMNVNSRDDLNHANHLVRARTFAGRAKSLVYVIDDEREAALPPIARFVQEPELDEIVVAVRQPLPALDAGRGGEKVRVVCSGSADTPLGDLVRLGLDSARGDVLVLTGGGDTFVASDVGKLLVYLRDADMVVGTRTTRQMIEQGANMRGLIRAVHIGIAKLVELLWWRFDARFTDICCVYQAFWRSTYEAVREQADSTGVEIFPELVIETLRARKRIIEVPVNYCNRDLESPYVRSRYQSAGTLWRILRLIVAKRVEDGWGWND